MLINLSELVSIGGELSSNLGKFALLSGDCGDARAVCARQYAPVLARSSGVFGAH